MSPPSWGLAGTGWGCRPTAPLPSGHAAAVFVLLTAPVISAQHTQEVLSGIVHPRPDLYRKKSIKSHPSTSAVTSCLCAAGGRPCGGCEAGTRARAQGGHAGMAAGSHRAVRRQGRSRHGGGQRGAAGTVRGMAIATEGTDWDRIGWRGCPCQATVGFCGQGCSTDEALPSKQVCEASPGCAAASCVCAELRDGSGAGLLRAEPSP